MQVKKSKMMIVFILVLVATLIMAVSSASADTRKITLLNAVVKDGMGGLTLTFRVEGEFEDFSGSVWLGGKSYALACHLKGTNDSILVCKGAERGLDMLAYKNVWGEVNGFPFEAFVDKEFCYSIYDFMPLFGDAVNDPVTRGILIAQFEKIGNICQDPPAVVGDSIGWDHPVYGMHLYLYLESFNCFERINVWWDDQGPGYYPLCRIS